MRTIKTRKRAFSMIELMVVIGIVALISSITLGTFRSVANGNRKTSCQSNMQQIYGAARLYAQDFNGKFPLLNGTGIGIKVGTDLQGDVIMKPGDGIGLWALYAYGDAPAPATRGELSNLPLPTDNIVLSGYLKSTKAFHCPNDDYSYTNTSLGINGLNTADLRYTNGARTYFNPAYLSYQSPPRAAAGSGVIPDDLTATAVYSSFRVSGSSEANNERRQLVSYNTASTPVVDFSKRTEDTTVVMWCRFHRKLNKDGTIVSATDINNHDNVLFADGSVQWVESVQPITGTANSTAVCKRGWDRYPTQIQYAVDKTANTVCQN